MGEYKVNNAMKPMTISSRSCIYVTVYAAAFFLFADCISVFGKAKSIEAAGIFSGESKVNLKDDDLHISNTHQAWHKCACVAIRSMQDARDVKFTVKPSVLSQTILMIRIYTP